MKIVLQAWPPLFARGLAGVIAAVVLGAIAVVRRERLSVPLQIVPSLLRASLTNVFAWMGFATLSLQSLSVAESALLVFTMPIWATLFVWPIRGVPPKRLGIVALGLGGAGILVLLGGEEAPFTFHQLLGMGFALAAAILFALGTTIERSPLPLTPLASTAWQLALGCLPMLLAGVLFEQPAFVGPQPLALLGLLYVTLIPMAACYLTWFAALRRLSPSAASSGLLLVPLVGVLSATVMLGEPLGPREIVSILLTLAGVALAVLGG